MRANRRQVMVSMHWIIFIITTFSRSGSASQVPGMYDAMFEALQEQWYPAGRQTQPADWNDEAFNNPAQPVVGICWYEAGAYCRWLSAQANVDFRLPTEAEWEAAARGRTGRRYAYGDEFDIANCNLFATHIPVFRLACASSI